MVTSFIKLHWQFAVTLANFLVAGQFAWGLLLLLSRSPGQVEALAGVEGN